MNHSDQLYIDHEIRIRIGEETLKDMKEMRKEMHSNFRWTLGTLLLLIVTVLTFVVSLYTT